MSTDNILAPVAALTLPDGVLLNTRATSALKFIEAFEIKEAGDYELAADELRSIKAKAKAIEDQRTAITGPINQALKAINSLFKGPGDLLGQAETMLKRKMLTWDQEQERIRAEEQRRADEAAAAERRKLEAEALERQRQADAAAQAASEAAAAGNQAAAELSYAEAQRTAAEAQAATTAALVVSAPVVQAAPKVAGISTSKRVDFEVESLAQLVAFIVTGNGDTPLARPELIGLLIADSVKLRAQVKATGMATNLPGVRVFETKSMSARAA